MSTLRVTNIQDLAGNDVFSLSGGNMTVAGNLTVQGTTTSIDTTNLEVLDKNIILGNTTDPAASDTTADGGGITLKGTTDKTFNWVDSTDSWTSSEHIELASNKEFRINGNSVLSADTLGSGVTSSSLTTVGTITSGTWEGTAIATNYIADDAVTGGKLADDISISTTGTISAASYTVTGSTAPTNGIYLSGTNVVAISTNSSEKLTVSSGGRLSFAPTGGNLYIDPNPTSASPTVFLNRPYLPNTATGTSILFDTIGVNYSAGADDGNGGTVPYTANTLIHYRARPVTTLNEDVTLESQFGFYVDDDLDNATNNYGFYSNIGLGANRWNVYINGSANNYLSGNVGVGTTDIGAKLEVSVGSNWNFSNLILRRTASNINTNISFISFVLGTNAEGDDNIINPTADNVFLGLNTSSTPSSTSTVADLNAQLVINAPNGATVPYGNVGIGETSPNSKLAVNGSITESTDGGTTYHNVVTEQDIGTDPNQVPLNQFLGQLAFMDKVGDVPASSTDPQNNFDINFEYVNDTTIKIRMRGSDGVVRSVQFTLS